jgi:endosialidase-like protein
MRSVRTILPALMLWFAAQPIFSQTDQANEIRCSTATACKTTYIPRFSSNGGSATVNDSLIRQSAQNIIISGSLGVGTSTPTQRLDLGNNGNAVVKTDPGNDTTAGNVGYGLISRGTGGVPNAWWIITAPVGGGFGVPSNSLSMWQYPPNQDPACCLQRFTIFPSSSGQTVSTMAIDGHGHLHIEHPTTGDELFTSSLEIGAPADGSAAANIFGYVYIGDDLSVLGCVQLHGGGSFGTCVSDARLKKNIQPFPPVLDQLVQLRPVSYDWRSDEFPQLHLDTGRSFGLIAQEVESVFPEMVSADKKGFKRVNYTELPTLMLQAIRELKAENDNLRERIERLENAASH